MSEILLSRNDRTLALQALYTGEPKEAGLRKFLESRVLVSGDAITLSTDSGKLMLMTVLNLVARFCSRIDILAPKADDLVKDALSLLNRIDASDTADFRPAPENSPAESYAAILYIGTQVEGVTDAICINASGWLATIAYGTAPVALPPSVDTRNPFGAIGAACLGSAEVFKRLMHAEPSMVSPLGAGVLSVYDYSFVELRSEVNPGPVIPTFVIPETLLAGAGAIGNAFTYALRHVAGASGRLTVVDKKDVSDSGLNRCVETFHDDAYTTKTAKVEVIERAFRGTEIVCAGFNMDIEEYLLGIFAGAAPRPTVVVSGVDNNEARKSLQALWPDVLLEGATGRAGLHVFKHEFQQGNACLMCIHPSDHVESTTYAVAVANETGLPLETIQASLQGADVSLTARDLLTVTQEHASALAVLEGQPMCSVLAEIAKLSRRPDAVPKAASVSFVSMMAGMFTAAELVKRSCGMTSTLETMYVLETFAPLRNAYLQPLDKVRSCACSTNAAANLHYRAMV